MVMLLFTPWLYYLPRAVLGAVIIVAVWGLFDFKAFTRISRVNRRDGVVAAVTFWATIFLAPQIATGILIGIPLSVDFQIVRMMRPHVAILGRHPDGTLRDIHRHGLTPDPEILAVRFDGRLIFANAAHFEESLLAARSKYPGRTAVLLVAEGINEIDSSGEAMLREVVRELQRQGIPSVSVAALDARLFPADYVSRQNLGAICKVLPFHCNNRCFLSFNIIREKVSGVAPMAAAISFLAKGMAMDRDSPNCSRRKWTNRDSTSTVVS